MKRTGKVIIIGRQYGCGARAIGKRLARELGLPYYDKEMLLAAAAESGMSLGELQAADERKPSLLRSFMGASFGASTSYSSYGSLSQESLYNINAETIRRIVEKGEGAVFVGRTADYILRDYPGLLSVFLHAPLSYRAGQLKARGETGNLEEGTQLARKHDRLREQYYNYYTGRHWGSASNYHLSINVAEFGEEKVIKTIKSLLTP